MCLRFSAAIDMKLNVQRIKIQKARDKKLDTCYFTTKSLHDIIVKIDRNAKWSKTTIYCTL